MTTILLEEKMSVENVRVKDLKELYYFIINSPQFTEMWILEKNDLSKNELDLLEKSKKSSNRINI